MCPQAGKLLCGSPTDLCNLLPYGAWLVFILLAGAHLRKNLAPRDHRLCLAPRSTHFELMSGAALCICVNIWVVFRASAKEHIWQQFGWATEVGENSKARSEFGDRLHASIWPIAFCHPQDAEVLPDWAQVFFQGLLSVLNSPSHQGNSGYSGQMDRNYSHLVSTNRQMVPC